MKVKKMSEQNMTDLKPGGFRRVTEELRRNYILYLLAIPVVLYFLIFCYLPMGGLVMAFKDYKVMKGIWGSEWVGFKHFATFLSDPSFISVMKNTILISFYDLLFGFPAPIIFALLLNEIKQLRYKKVIQTVTYLPHFISLVVICGMIMNFLKPEGVLTSFFSLFGAARVNHMLVPSEFKAVYIASGIWQEVGWGSIIYLSALSSIDQQLYEAAVIDGAGKWKQTLHITLPGIASTIVILFIMRMGQVLGVGYEKIILLQNSYNHDVSQVISSYIYEVGLSGNYPRSDAMPLSAAAGLFQSVINIMFLVVTNAVSKKYSEYSLF